MLMDGMCHCFVRVCRKVIAGMVDPFPLVAGKGLERLRQNGVEVRVTGHEFLLLCLNEEPIERRSDETIER